MKLSIRNVRLRFGAIWEPQAPRPPSTSTPKYNGTFLLDPKVNKEDIKLIRETIKKVAKEKWKDKAERILRTIESDKQKFCYMEEDMLNDEGDEVDGAEGMFYIRANNETMPSYFDRDGQTELTRKDGRPYKGAYVLAKLDIWAQDNTHGKAIRCELRGIQFMKDGPAFGGGTKAAADEYEDLSDQGDEDEDTPAPKKRARASDDDDDTPAPKKRRPPVEDDDDDIG